MSPESKDLVKTLAKIALPHIAIGLFYPLLAVLLALTFVASFYLSFLTVKNNWPGDFESLSEEAKAKGVQVFNLSYFIGAALSALICSCRFSA